MPTRRALIGDMKRDTQVGNLAQMLAGTIGSAREQCLFTTGVTVDGDLLKVAGAVYDFIVVNTDSTADLDGDISATATIIPTKTAAPGVAKGELIKIDSEVMLVTNIAGSGVGLDLTVTRGYAGTAAATHSNNAAILIHATHRKPAPGHLAIPMGGTLTAAGTQSLMIAAVNYFGTQGYNKLRAQAGASTTVILSRPFGEDGFGVVVGALSATIDDTTTTAVLSRPLTGAGIGDYLRIESEIVQIDAIAANRKTLTIDRAELGTAGASHAATKGCTTVTAWNSTVATNHTVEAFFRGGSDALGVRRTVLFRVVTAAEASGGVIIQPLDQAALGVVSRVFDASANFLEVIGAGKEATTYTAASGTVPAFVTVTEGSTAWAAGDYLLLEVFHAVPAAPLVA